jgi:hypothetical protein
MDDWKKKVNGILTELTAGILYLLLTFMAAAIILG